MNTETLLIISLLLIGFMSGIFFMLFLIYRRFKEHIDKTVKNKDKKKNKTDNSVYIEFPIKAFESDDVGVELPNANSNQLKEKIIEKLSACEKEQEFEKAIRYRNLKCWVDENFENRKQWFLDRVGKKVKQSKIICECPRCTREFEKGILVKNKQFAMILFAEENANRLALSDLVFEDLHLNGSTNP